MSDDSLVASTPLYQAIVGGGVDYRPWAGLPLSDDQCFLCGVQLNDSNRTVEDVIPKWVQQRLPVRWHGLQLPNLTALRPGLVLIPACELCNTRHLSQIERQMADSFKRGPSAVQALHERTLRLWAAKVAYGSRRNDMRLRSDIRDKCSTPIATPADLEQLRMVHLLLPEARDVVHVTAGHSTFLTFDAQAAVCGVCDFDLAVPIGWPNPIMLRIGAVALLGARRHGAPSQAIASP
jgi:hypothetical protein